LRQILAMHGIAVPPAPPTDSTLTQAAGTGSLESKEARARKRITLFRSLFRGREDVYARRWENARGQAGYAPAALKDWKAINTSRPEDRKKVELKTRKLESRKRFTIAIVTHNLQQAQRVADYTGFLYVDTTQGGRTGYLVGFGDSKQLFGSPVHKHTQDYIRGEFS
jgi:hypothetical protein